MVTIGLAIYIISAIGAILYIRYDSEYDETYPDESDGVLLLVLCPALNSVVAVYELGKYLLREGEKTIYIDFYPGAGYYGNIWNKRQITNIIGVGRGINYDVVNTQGGKTKYLCSIDTSLVFGRPDICFYFKK